MHVAAMVPSKYRVRVACIAHLSRESTGCRNPSSRLCGLVVDIRHPQGFRVQPACVMVGVEVLASLLVRIPRKRPRVHVNLFSGCFELLCSRAFADFGMDGYAVGYPTAFSGDYFLPGSPVEGWSVEYTLSTTKAFNRCASGMRGLAGFHGVKPCRINALMYCMVICRFLQKGKMGLQSIAPTTVQDTSAAGILGGVWVGQGGQLKISKATTFNVNNLYFVTTVTLKNVGSVALKDVMYMRNVDPDQEQVRRLRLVCVRTILLDQPRCIVRDSVAAMDR
jgi:hypothetical protein